MTTTERPKCPEDGTLMAKAGMAFSGRVKVQRYKCSKCGRSLVPTHLQKQNKNQEDK